MDLQAQKTVKNEVLIPAIISILNEGKTVLFNATGKSMRPFIDDGEKVELEKCYTFATGNIVLAHLPRSSGSYVLHRIIEFQGDSVLLMGDGNLMNDGFCHKDSLKAVCRAKYDSLDKRIDLDSDIQKARANLWKSNLIHREHLLFIFLPNNEKPFWEELFQEHLISEKRDLCLNKKYETRKMGEEFILYSSETTYVDFSSMTTLNETAAFIFTSIKGRIFNLNDCVDILLKEYEVDRETATRDCIRTLTDWFSIGLIDVQ